MSNIPFKRILLTFSHNRSLESTVRQLLGRKRFKLLTKNLSDWREATAVAAKLFSMNEDVLISDIACLLKMPRIHKVPVINLAELPLNINFADLKQCGCVPYYRGDKISGVICVDPDRAQQLFAKFANLSYALSSWSAINECLNLSQRESQYNTSQLQLAATTSLEKEVSQAIKYIIEQADLHSGNQFELDLTDQRIIHYRFQTVNFKVGYGEVSIRIAEALKRKLRYLCLRNETIYLGNSRHATVWASNKENDDFYVVHFLIEGTNKSSKASHEAHLLQDSAAQFTALIVEDDNYFAKVLARILSKQGINSALAPNGQEALCLLESMTHKPDILICDLNLPKMNGIEFISAVRSNPLLRNIPAVVLTSEADVEREIDAISRGANDFLNKAEDPRLIRVKIERLLEGSRRHAA